MRPDPCVRESPKAIKAIVGFHFQVSDLERDHHHPDTS